MTAPAATRERRERLGLSDLDRVVLDPQIEAELGRAATTSMGSAMWKARKHAEARDLLALAQIAPRMTVLALDLATTLHAFIRLRGAAPCLPDAAEELEVAHEIHLALRFPPEILTSPQPGYSVVQVMTPQNIHHPNVSRGAVQMLCLGASIPTGFPLREAVLGAYAALTLQSIQLDELDHAGVMNADAARFWQARPHQIPLSTEPFLADLSADDEGGRS